MLNFCTLFDHNYLSRGLILYESLKKHCSEAFNLYILAFDDTAYNWLKEKKYENIIVQSLADIKSAYPVLERLEQERTRTEFSWTLSSFSIQFFIKKFNLDSITYIDSDVCFYNDPQIILNEIKEESVIITPHNYTPKYDQTAKSGRYCVQFMYFKNNVDGNKVLEWWCNECEKCCSGKAIDGKFGDQKYLDDWLSRFPGIVHETQSLGYGIAPWNVQQAHYEIDEKNCIQLVNNVTGVKLPVLFYHFHGLKKLYVKNNIEYYDLNSGYEMSQNVVKTFYKNYILRLEELEKICPPCNKINYRIDSYFLKNFLRIFKWTFERFIKLFNPYKTYKEIVAAKTKKNLYKLENLESL